MHDGGVSVVTVFSRAARPASAHQAVAGGLLAVALVAALGGVMFPLRSHLSAATSALVLVIPVVAGVAVGGFSAGVVATAAGFLLYDLVFIPPYYTLNVGAVQNWTALGVYAAVMVITARVVAELNVARTEAQARAAEVRRLFDLSELLVRESTLAEVLATIVKATRRAFGLNGVALFLPSDGQLRLMASDGVPLSEEELGRLGPGDRPVSLESARVASGGVQVLPLVASGQPIALLALRGLPAGRRSSELLGVFANHLALTLERAELREEAVRAQLLGEVDRVRRSLMGAVSHDLRTPLASIKLSASTLADPDAQIDTADVKELGELIDEQADRLERLVSNLLDMTRIQSGALELRRQTTDVGDLVAEALSMLSPAEGQRVRWRSTTALPLVDVDHVLIRQVLANLIDNATRYSPPGSPVTVAAVALEGGQVEVSVNDCGPGIAADERTSVFQMFNRREAGGRGGLGLAIAHAFLEAHGQRIWVADGVPHGARFVFTLPAATEAKAG